MRGGVALLVLAALAMPSPGPAAWSATGSGAGKARAKTLPTTAAAKPTATASSHDVTVTWTASTFAEGGAVPSYRVTRYNALNQSQAVAAACAGTVTGVSCVEHSVPTGTWTYTVTPRVGSWENLSTESPKSDPVVVTL